MWTSRPVSREKLLPAKSRVLMSTFAGNSRKTQATNSVEKLSELLKVESNRISTQTSVVITNDPPLTPPPAYLSAKTSAQRIAQYYRRKKELHQKKSPRLPKRLSPMEEQAMLLAEKYSNSKSAPKLPSVVRTQASFKRNRKERLAKKAAAIFGNRAIAKTLSKKPMLKTEIQLIDNFLDPPEDTLLAQPVRFIPASIPLSRHLTEIESRSSSSPSLSIYSPTSSSSASSSCSESGVFSPAETLSSGEDALTPRRILKKQGQVEIYKTSNSEMARRARGTVKINEQTAEIFMEKKNKVIRKASRMGALSENPVQIVFSDLRHKLLSGAGMEDKFKKLASLPKWLIESPEYRQIVEQHSKKRSIFEICRRQGTQRSGHEKQLIKQYVLQNVSYFQSIPSMQIDKISQKLYSENYGGGQQIFAQGSVGNKMYIIVEGVVEVLIDKCKVAELKKNQVFGETALTLNAPRGATIRAVTNTKCIILRKQDYESAIVFVKRLEKLQNERFVQNQTLICHWCQTKKQNFTFHIESRRYKAGQVIFEQGDPSKVFYILKEGRLQVEMGLDIETNNKYPIDKQSWEVLKTTKRILHFVNYIESGDAFGHEQMLEGNIPRKRRVSAVRDSEVIYVKQCIFQKWGLENLNLEKIKNQVVNSQRRFTRINSVMKLQKRQSFVSRGSMQFGKRGSDAGNQSRRGSIISIGEQIPHNHNQGRFAKKMSIFNKSATGFPLVPHSANLSRKSTIQSARGSIWKNAEQALALNKTLRVVKETKVISDFHEFLDQQQGRTGDLNVKIVGSLTENNT